MYHDAVMTGLTLWTITTLIFGFALWLATEIMAVKIQFRWLVMVVVASSIVARLSIIGELLASIVAVRLLYRFSDSDVSINQITFATILARAFALLVALGIYSSMNRHDIPSTKTAEQILESISNSTP
jgi:hypothetical protein